MQATSKLNLSWSDEELNSPEVAKSLHMWWKVVIYYTLRFAAFCYVPEPKRFDTDPDPRIRTN